MVARSGAAASAAAPHPSRTVALCADDYALTPGVSAGILKAVASGRLLTVSAMTTRPCWSWAARELAPFLDKIEVGLHLNLTLGAPLSTAPRLAPAGQLPRPARLLVAALSGALPEGEVGAEIARQLDAFEAELGRPPDFVDGHWHVHALTGVRRPLFDELERRGLQGRVRLRDCGDRWPRIVARGTGAAKALVVAALASGFPTEAHQRGFHTNDGFSGFSSFDAAHGYARVFSRCLVAMGPRHLVMCHPGHVDRELFALDDATASREAELAFVLSDTFVETLAARGLTLARLAAPMAPEAGRST